MVDHLRREAIAAIGRLGCRQADSSRLPNRARRARPGSSRWCPTLYDVSRQIALWVSAFEVLVRPGPSGQAGRNAVMDPPDRAHWKYRDCTAWRYPVRSGKEAEYR